MAQRQEITVALVGYGGAFNMGLHHRNAMEATGRMRVVAVCDVDPVRRAAAQEELGGTHSHICRCQKAFTMGRI